MTIIFGKLESSLSGQFVVVFTIDGIERKFSARFSPEATLFPVGAQVILSYVTKDQLRGNASFSGQSIGDEFNLSFSSGGVSIRTGPPSVAGPLGEAKAIKGTGTWDATDDPGDSATGTIHTTSSTTFVAVFSVDNVRKKFSAIFNPPLSTFSSDLVHLSFNNPGQMIGPGIPFHGHVGVTDAHFALGFPQAPGVTISGQLTKHKQSKYLLSGIGSWDESVSRDSIAHGILNTTTPSTFTIVFNVDDRVYKFFASFSPPVSRFSSNEMKLTYQNLGQLSGALAFNGEVGINAIHLTAQSGFTMHGALDFNVFSKETISGTGTWSTGTSNTENHEARDIPVKAGDSEKHDDPGPAQKNREQDESKHGPNSGGLDHSDGDGLDHGSDVPNASDGSDHGLDSDEGSPKSRRFRQNDPSPARSRYSDGSDHGSDPESDYGDPQGSPRHGLGPTRESWCKEELDRRRRQLHQRNNSGSARKNRPADELDKATRRRPQPRSRSAERPTARDSGRFYPDEGKSTYGRLTAGDSRRFRQRRGLGSARGGWNSGGSDCGTDYGSDYGTDYGED